MKNQPKGLNSGLVTLGIVVVVCVGLLTWLLMQGGSGGGKDTDTSPDSYAAIQAVIKNYSMAAKWDETEYNRILKKTENSSANGTITDEQKKELEAYIRSEYIKTLKAAINDFLITAAAGAGPRLAEFDAAISRLGNEAENNVLRTGINAFYRMLNLRKQIFAYTRNEQFNEYTTSTFKQQMSQALTVAPLDRNKYLSDLQKACSEELDTHQAKDSYWRESVLPNIKTDTTINCGVFSPYNYYYNQCTIMKGQN